MQNPYSQQYFVKALRVPYGVLTELAARKQIAAKVFEMTQALVHGWVHELHYEIWPKFILNKYITAAHQRKTNPDVPSAEFLLETKSVDAMSELLIHDILHGDNFALYMSDSKRQVPSENQRKLFAFDPYLLVSCPHVFNDKEVLAEAEVAHPDLFKNIGIVTALYDKPLDQYRALKILLRPETMLVYDSPLLSSFDSITFTKSS